MSVNPGAPPVSFIFGTAAMNALPAVTTPIVVYGLLSLTIVRMVPVAIATVRSGLPIPLVAFLGWFGPRGLASTILAVLVIRESPELPGAPTIYLTMVVTATLSVVLHGLTSAPLAARLARQLA